jgi:hypothetical protein
VHAYVDLVVAVFPTRDQAQAGLNALQQAGFAPAQCGLVTRSGELGESGGLLARRHSADEGPFDALIELGVPGDAARLYQQTFEARQTIVAVRAPERADQAISVLRQVAKMDARQELIDPRPLDRQSADRPVGRPLRPVRRRTARGSSRVRS